jgi:fumarate reductase subunit C
MRSKGRERTRTAPPQLPDQYPFSGRYRSYMLFGATSIVYLLLALLALRVVWALGDGRAAFERVIAGFENPLYVAFHVFALVCVCFVGVRFYGLFPKAQPPRIGPLRPPRRIIHVMLYAIWIGTTALFAAILAGALPQ